MVTVSKFFEIQNSAYRSTGPSPPNGPPSQKACAKMGRFDGLDRTCMVLTLRVDPWNNDVRDVDTEFLPTNAAVDPFVESARWGVIPSQRRPRTPAGAVLSSEEDARIEGCLVNRKLVMGNGISENADIRFDSVHSHIVAMLWPDTPVVSFCQRCGIWCGAWSADWWPIRPRRSPRRSRGTFKLFTHHVFPEQAACLGICKDPSSSVSQPLRTLGRAG